MTLAFKTFVRVYKLPEKLVDGFCFGNGVPITFTNVDWFEVLVDMPDIEEELTRWVKKKKYYDPKAQFLVLVGHPPQFSFLI